jgi:hypothetical protein
MCILTYLTDMKMESDNLFTFNFFKLLVDEICH